MSRWRESGLSACVRPDTLRRTSAHMDIFDIHRGIVGDYANYIRSFVSISDDELRQTVEQHLNDGHLVAQIQISVDRYCWRRDTAVLPRLE